MGSPTDPTRTFPAVVMSNAWLSGQGAIATNPVYILKQTGTSRYLVTDGTHTGTVKLQGTDATAPGQAAMYVTPYVTGAESGAVFTATYKVTGATVNVGGTGYATGNVITLGNGITVTVSTVNVGVITAVTITTPGSRGSVNTAATTNVAQVSVNPTGGTGATFNLVYNLNAVAISGAGTGYTVGETLDFVGIAAGTPPTASIATVNGSGAPQTLTVTSGTNVTASATSVVTNNSLARVYAKVLKNRTVKTWIDTVYSWDPYAAATLTGEATIPLSGAGTEAATYHEANEFAVMASSAPYKKVNVGVTPKQSQIFATAGVPGGAGKTSQATPNVGTSAGGVFNPSSTMRKLTEKEKRDAQNAAKLKTVKSALRAKQPDPTPKVAEKV